MKLMTLNCHSWQEENQLDKIKILAERIKKEQYDVIALQEISQHIDGEYISENIKSDNYVQVLINELNNINEDSYKYVWDFSHIGYDVFEEGLAILSRHKIKSYDSFYVSQNQSENNYKSRKILKATIEANGKEIDFFSCHLGWWNDKEDPFKKQVDTLLKHIDDNKLSFLMGDFNNNALLRNEGYDYIIAKGMIDTYIMAEEKDSGITVKGTIDGWRECSEDKRLDLILSTKKIEVKDSKVIFNRENYIVSDHFGVEININL